MKTERELPYVGPNGVRPRGERRSPLRDVSKSSPNNNVLQTSATGNFSSNPRNRLVASVQKRFPALISDTHRNAKVPCYQGVKV
jgi:hypothetical protein